MMSELTKQDMDVLIEAVEAWESKDAFGDMVGNMMGSMMCKDDDSRKKFDEQQDTKHNLRKQETKVRKERSIVLRSKLIAMRDAMEAGAFVESAAGE